MKAQNTQCLKTGLVTRLICALFLVYAFQGVLHNNLFTRSEKTSSGRSGPTKPQHINKTNRPTKKMLVIVVIY